MSKEILENCQLVWEKHRGVIYVTNKDTGQTVLRISSLEFNRKGRLSEGMIDITVTKGLVTYPDSTFEEEELKGYKS